MKIVITGAQGVGKTTLANQISTIKNYKLLPEVARIMIDMGHTLDMGVTLDLEFKMLNIQKKMEEDEAPWVADRCLIDIVAYSGILFPNSRKLNRISFHWLKKSQYDLIFYLPIEFPIEDDGVRSIDVDFQQQVDKKIKHVLNQISYKNAKPRLFTITGSKEERLKKVLDILDLSIIKNT